MGKGFYNDARLCVRHFIENQAIKRNAMSYVGFQMTLNLSNDPKWY